MGSFLSGQRTVATAGDGPELVAPVDLAAELRPYWLATVELLPASIATMHDTQLVVQLCQALYVQAKAWQQILDGGIDTVDATHGGEKRRNPAIITWRQASEMALQCMNLLGMSPASRARLRAADGDRADPFVEYLRRRHGPPTD